MTSSPLENLERQTESVWRRFAGWAGYAVIGLIVMLGLCSFTGFAIAEALGVFALMAIYFVPAIIADCRHHRDKHPIMFFNIFLGWTVVGWVTALVWSFTAATKKIVGSAVIGNPGSLE